jgi:murein L,D-transpeptidase YcbB/YkuD
MLTAALCAATLACAQPALAQQARDESSVSTLIARLEEQKQAWLEAAQADPQAPIAAHITVPAHALRRGTAGFEVAVLCAALEARGFEPCTPEQHSVDAALAARITAAQRYYGLAADGIADSQLYNALSLSAAERAERVTALITEWQGIRARAAEMGADKYIVVNVPAYEVRAMDGDTVALTSKAVVGRPERQTPLGVINVRAIKYNPDWTPPATVLKHDIYPALANGGAWIRAHGLQLRDRAGKVVDWEGLTAEDIRNAGYRFVQPASETAALGLLKFETDSSQNIYLHDTNERNLFARAARARSSGCIRVERWRELAAWMVDTDVSGVEHKVATRKTFFEATPKVPVFIVYQLADVQDGHVVFYPDIYQRNPENSNKKALVAQR